MAIADCRLSEPTHVREDTRGSFIEVVNEGPWEAVITGSMKAGAVLGRHYHRVTDMLFHLIDGAVEVSIVEVESGASSRISVGPRQSVRLNANEAHAIRFLEESRYLLLKSRRYDADDPDTYPFPVES